MATLKQLIECEISDFFAGFGHPGEPETPEEMQSQLLARVMPLLAGLEREPVAQVYQPANIGICAPLGPSVMMLKPLNPGTKLYAAPQLPQPAVVSEWRMMCGEWRDETVSIHDDSGLIVSGISPNAAGIIIEAHNARCGAMLQGADQPQNAQQNIPENIPTLREALAAIRNLGPIDAEKIQAERDALNEPDVPDGYALVPVEPTAEMVAAAMLSDDVLFYQDDDTMFRVQHDVIWRAMLAAAPDFREISNSSTKHFRENAETSTKCWCLACRPVTMNDARFVVCPDCGNKRCPHANDHRNACTGSNEPGQEGSAYPAAPQQEVKSALEMGMTRYGDAMQELAKKEVK